jgi:hypothetical protein
METMDAESVEAGTGPRHPEIDNDFRSGVLLGMEIAHLLRRF